MQANVEFTVKLDTEAMRTLGFFEHFNTRLNKAIQYTLKTEAALPLKLMRDGMRRSAPAGVPLRPLRPATVKKKIQQGYGKNAHRPLIRSEALMKSITKFQTDKSGMTWFVGFPHGVAGPDGHDLGNIMDLHESGRRGPWAVGYTARHPGFPARPVIRPVYNFFLKGFTDRFMRMLETLIFDPGWMRGDLKLSASGRERRAYKTPDEAKLLKIIHARTAHTPLIKSGSAAQGLKYPWRGQAPRGIYQTWGRRSRRR